MVVRVKLAAAGALSAAADFAVSGNWKTVHVTNLLRTFAGSEAGLRGRGRRGFRHASSEWGFHQGNAALQRQNHAAIVLS